MVIGIGFSSSMPAQIDISDWVGNRSIQTLNATIVNHNPIIQYCCFHRPAFSCEEEYCFEIQHETDTSCFNLCIGDLSDMQTQENQDLLSYYSTPRYAIEYIMENISITRRKDEKEYGENRTKLRILEIYDQMTHCPATNTEFRSPLNPLPGPPCDAEGNFTPVDKWDKNNWPKHVHEIKEEYDR